MRLIGTVNNEIHAKRISSYLKVKGIENSSDVAFDPQSSQMSYSIWVLDEDRILEAAADFERFQKTPSDPEFDPPVALQIDPEEPPQTEEPEEKPPVRAPVTIFFLGLCFAIFFLNFLEETPMRKAGLTNLFMLTPIQSLLLYDLPPAIDSLEEMIQDRLAASGDHPPNLTQEVKAGLEIVDQTPSWRGFYDWVILKIQGQDSSLAEGPLFLKVRQGELWRLFSPCVLHSEFLHILFNMIWLWILGRSIEQRLGVFRTLLLTLIVGLGSNAMQYLMGGPFFIGYSGVIMGLAGFIWMRQKVAPWEGYPLNRMTILFLLLFVGSMFLLTFASFFLQIFTDITFAPNIANTAHIAGAIAGAFLGRLSYFSWKAER